MDIGDNVLVRQEMLVLPFPIASAKTSAGTVATRNKTSAANKTTVKIAQNNQQPRDKNRQHVLKTAQQHQPKVSQTSGKLDWGDLMSW